MSGASIGLQLASDFFNNISHNPIFLLSFVVPILLLLFASFAMRRYTRKTRIDGPPSLEQKREKFIIPRDFFARETEKILADDYAHFLNPITREFESLKEYHEYFKALEKRYRRYVAMSRSSRKKRKKAGMDGRKKTFDDILNLYNQLRSNNFDIIEFEQEDRIL